jgi:tRNA(fMet)-specific endonuclease VapC
LVCLDSDILISFLRGDPAAAGKVSSLKEGSQGPLKTTVINEYELLKGAGLSKLRDRNQVQVKRLISEMEVLELDSEACDIGAGVFNHLKDRGSMVNELDILVAGIVLRNRETLVSRDSGFRGMPELSVLEW